MVIRSVLHESPTTSDNHFGTCIIYLIFDSSTTFFDEYFPMQFDNLFLSYFFFNFELT